MYDDYIVIIIPRRRLTASELHERYHPHYFGDLYMRSFEKRLSLLEGKQLPDAVTVERWIAAGRFYDDLTDEEKEMYCSYKLVDREVFEEIETAVTGTLHHRLERNARGKMTASGREKIIQEVEALIDTIENEEKRKGVYDNE